MNLHLRYVVEDVASGSTRLGFWDQQVLARLLECSQLVSEEAKASASLALLELIASAEQETAA